MRLALTIAILAGSATSIPAQEIIKIHYSWFEVQANSTIPIFSGNSIVDPGEGARIRLGITALINGSSAIGQTLNYSNPPPGGVGTVKGLGSVVWDLVGNGGQSSADGNWTSLVGPGAPFNSGTTPGTPQPGGNTVAGIGGAQFVAPGGSASSANNNQRVFQGTWTPFSYASRNVFFHARASVLVPTGEQNSVLFSYGQGTGLDTEGDPFNFDLLAGKYLPTDFGTPFLVMDIPAPSSAAILLGALPLTGRARRSASRETR